ncbi:MAG TPA: hypothetical protein PKY31_17500, partial [Spirochaetota bacterium]|nr:hypothetical protein [Spirochaetota bacterium]
QLNEIRMGIPGDLEALAAGSAWRIFAAAENRRDCSHGNKPLPDTGHAGEQYRSRKGPVFHNAGKYFFLPFVADDISKVDSQNANPA